MGGDPPPRSSGTARPPRDVTERGWRHAWRGPPHDVTGGGVVPGPRLLPAAGCGGAGPDAAASPGGSLPPPGPRGWRGTPHRGLFRGRCPQTPPGMGMGAGKGRGGHTTSPHAFFVLLGFFFIFVGKAAVSPAVEKGGHRRVAEVTPHQNTKTPKHPCLVWVCFFGVVFGFFAGGDAVSFLRKGGTHGEETLLHADFWAESELLCPQEPH